MKVGVYDFFSEKNPLKSFALKKLMKIFNIKKTNINKESENVIICNIDYCFTV